MDPALVALSSALHALATAVFVGHFVLLGFVYRLETPEVARALGVLSRAARPWLYGSLAVLAITGTHLMLVDGHYRGFLRVGVRMAAKHVLVGGLVLVGFGFNVMGRIGHRLRGAPEDPVARAGFRRYIRTMATLGIAVVALTAWGQAL